MEILRSIRQVISRRCLARKMEDILRVMLPKRAGLMRILLAALLSLSAMGVCSAQSDKSAQSSPAPLGKPELVQVGFYPLAVYDIDMGGNSSQMDFYIWFKWNGDVDPTQSIEFTNMVDESGGSRERILESPRLLADGRKYQIMRVEGRFVQRFSFEDYPLDLQSVTVRVEDSRNSSEDVVFAVDTVNSTYDQNLEIPGWTITTPGSRTFLRHYRSNFGIDLPNVSYAGAEFSLELRRPTSLFYWKLLLPLVIVLLAGLSAFILPPQDIDTRAALPAGALLTAIFLQKTYVDTLPEIDYLVLMDKIYLISYFCILLTLGRVLFVYTKCDVADESTVARISRTDRILLLGTLLFFAAATLGLVTWTRWSA